MIKIGERPIFQRHQDVRATPFMRLLEGRENEAVMARWHPSKGGSVVL